MLAMYIINVSIGYGSPFQALAMSARGGSVNGPNGGHAAAGRVTGPGGNSAGAARVTGPGGHSKTVVAPRG